MAADVNSNLASWSTSEASNSPSGSTAISTNLDDNLRQIQAVVRKYLATKGSDLASGTTTDLSTTDGNFIDITGTTTITGFGTLSAGMWKVLQFDGALTLTHNGTSLILPGGANITTAAGDCLFAYSLGSGNWTVPFYQKASGTTAFIDSNAIVVGSSDATKKLRVEVDGFTTGNTRVMTPPDYDHRVMSQTKGADVASAGTLNLDTATGDLVDVTGTTGITAITLAEGKSATVRFTGVLTITHGSSLVLPNSSNITTTAGDFATFRGYAAGVVRCSSYSPTPSITHATAQASTSGTAIDFTSIPAGTKRITIMFQDVSSNGSSNLIIQIGDAGGIETTGYTGSTSQTTNLALSATVHSSGFLLGTNIGASSVVNGAVTLTLLSVSGDTWMASGNVGYSNAAGTATVGGYKDLSAELTQVRITATNGADTFDAGTINITYER
jgi:hypothetical protein